MGITYETAIEAAAEPRGWAILLMFVRGQNAGLNGSLYEPFGDMWDRYDYHRGHEVGRLIFEEVNGILMELDDERA